MIRDVLVVPAHAVKWGVNEALLVIVGAQVIGLVWASSLVGLGVLEIGDDGPVSIVALVLGNIGLWAGYALGPHYVASTRGEGAVRDFGLSIRPVDAPIGLAVGVIAQLVLLPLLYLPIGWFVDGDPSEAARELIATVDGNLDRWLLVLSAVIVAPLLEEFAYRGLLLRALQQAIGPAAAAFASAALFALLHFMVLQMPGLFLFGLLAAGVALWTGRLGTAVVTHMAFNATALIGEGLF